MQIDLQELRGKVHFAILTIREDEYGAVLDRFPAPNYASGDRRYEVGDMTDADGRTLRFVVARCVFQGEGEAQHLTHALIKEIDPALIVLAGIGGAVPSPDFTLGDVVCATHVHDFSVRAAAEGGRSTFNVGGGTMHPAILSMLGALPAIARALPEWNTPAALGREAPLVELPTPRTKTRVYGSLKWRRDVCESLVRHFPNGRPSRSPLATARAVASSDALIKDTGTLAVWQQSARALAAVEMELAGVYRAARTLSKEYPVLAIRGISDVVGFRRDDDWTLYACHTAASFAHALFRSGAAGELFGPVRDTDPPHLAPDPPAEAVERIGRLKFEICQRLSRVEALQLAHFFGMSRQLRDALQGGLESIGVWDYVESTAQMPDLPAALRAIHRQDLVARLK